jgi:hypothetical protein
MKAETSAKSSESLSPSLEGGSCAARMLHREVRGKIASERWSNETSAISEFTFACRKTLNLSPPDVKRRSPQPQVLVARGNRIGFFHEMGGIDFTIFVFDG